MALLPTLILAGCASSFIGNPISKKAIAFIEPGITQRAEVIENLGPPLIELKDPNVLAYSWGIGKPNAEPFDPAQGISVPGAKIYMDEDSLALYQSWTVETRRWVWCLALDRQGAVSRSGGFELRDGSSLETAVRIWAALAQH